MENDLRLSVIKQATLDAIGHQEEFPGQPVIGDWDSEAWMETFGDLESDDAELYWPIYQKTLLNSIRHIASSKYDMQGHKLYE